MAKKCCRIFIYYGNVRFVGFNGAHTHPAPTESAYGSKPSLSVLPGAPYFSALKKKRRRRRRRRIKNKGIVMIVGTKKIWIQSFLN